MCACVRMRGARVRVCVCAWRIECPAVAAQRRPLPLDTLHEQEQVGPAAGGEVRAGSCGEAACRGGERRGAEAEDQIFPGGDECSAQLGELRHRRVDDRLR